ncbi:MAG: hypothetical protein AB8I80_04950 [Anaerolineae bacterium]|jgi:hypothetical protein
MAREQVLLLAMTKMLSGICAAGVTRYPDPASGLRWIRPVRPFGSLLVGDMTESYGAAVIDLVAAHSRSG